VGVEKARAASEAVWIKPVMRSYAVVQRRGTRTSIAAADV
jgi:hypothetical protein